MSIFWYDYRVTGATKGVHVGRCSHCGSHGVMVVHAAVLRIYSAIRFSTVDALSCATCRGLSAAQTGLWRVGEAFGLLKSLGIAFLLAVVAYKIADADPYGHHPAFLPVSSFIVSLIALFFLRNAVVRWKNLRAPASLVPHPAGSLPPEVPPGPDGPPS